MAGNKQQHYARIRGALEAAGMPARFLEALAMAGQRLGIEGGTPDTDFGLLPGE